MTNKEILQADLLDILFENRNKAYGAYALRKNYNHRLQWALGISLGLVLFLISLLYKKKNSDQPMFERTEFILPTYKQPDKPKPLNTPHELEIGETKMVLVRFMVDVDGTISKTEIVQSGGDKYDREVIRVLHKMPKWVPAMQNGIKVATYFT